MAISSNYRSNITQQQLIRTASETAFTLTLTNGPHKQSIQFRLIHLAL